MANMSYCKFENTLADLYDCYDSLNDELSEDEARYRRELVALCKRIAKEFDEDE